MKAPNHSPNTALALAMQVFLLAFSYTGLDAQCPKVEAVMVDACGTEQLNEFIIIHSGNGFNTADIQLDYDPGNNILGQVNNDINTNNGNWPADPTPCGLMPGNTAAYAGCPNLIPVGPGVNIPANSIVVLQTSAGSQANTYSFSSLCGTGECVYIISSACTRSTGAFANGPGAGTNTINFSIAGGCNQVITYNLSSVNGGNGSYFLPLSGTYGNGGCVAPPSSPATPRPDINPIADVTVCNSYTLPPISGLNLTPNASYFTGSGGAGTQYNPGAMINSSTTLYAFDQNGPGCSDEEQFTIIVDTIDFTFQPIGNCGNFQFTNQSSASGQLTYSWNFDDPMSGVNNVSSQQNPTHQFSKCGTYNVCLTVSGNSCNGSICQTVIFSESVPPVIANCPPNTTLSTSMGQCYYDFTGIMPLTITDNCDPMPTLTCTWQDPFGTILPLTIPSQFVKGVHTIRCEAEDYCGNKSQICMFNLTIFDGEPPTLNCPLSMSYMGALDVNGNCTAQVNGLSPVATDNCPMLNVMHSISGATTGSGTGDVSGTTFSQGISTVTYTATDMGGNAKTCSFEVEVQCFPVEDDCLAWARQMGGTAADYGGSIATDASGNVYTTGYFVGTSDFDPGPGVFNLISTGLGNVFISKLDASGNFVWAKSIGGEVGNGIEVDALGDVYITGNFTGTVDFDPGAGVFNLTGNDAIFILKLDASGNFVWARQMSSSASSTGYKITVDALGNVYTVGWFSGTVDFDPGAGVANLASAGGDDGFISKLDASGNFLWAKRIGGVSQFDAVQAIAIDGSGDIYTTGKFEGIVDFDPGAGVFNLTSVGNTDIFVLKLDASGNFVWAKQMGGASEDVGNAVAIDLSGFVYATGEFSGTADFDPGVGVYNLNSAGGIGDHDIFISKLDAAGNFVWAKGMGGASSDDVGVSLATSLPGNVYATGTFTGTADFDPGSGVFNLTSGGLLDIFITQLDAAGNFVRVKQLGGPLTERPASLIMDASGCVYTTGYFYGTVDFDPNLNVFPLTSFGGPDIYVHKMCPCSLVSVEEESAAGEYALSQAYPNPFTFSTIIEYYLPEPTFVRLSVFDLLGREIAVLVDERKPAGNHSTTFEAAILPTGTYFYGMRAGDFRAIKKMVIMK